MGWKGQTKLIWILFSTDKKWAHLNKNTAQGAALDALLCMQKNMNYISSLIMIDKYARIVGGKK